jgi:NADPH:quinone reductase-like Zn-dependent oxidoreductase
MTEKENLSGLALRSKITANGELQVWLEDVTPPELAPDDVLLRVDASPINPSDLGVLFGPADLSTLVAGGAAERPTITASIPKARLASVAARFDQPMAVGNEGAGVVVKAGKNVSQFLGRTLGAGVGGMYTQLRVVKPVDCIILPDGMTAKEGAAAFINPVSVVAMIETMRREKHRALVHTAAASNLGQMLVKACLADGIALVNIVRSADQAKILREIGAKIVLDSTSPTFVSDLTDAVAETGATLAFDAIGGGSLAATILACMEAAQGRKATAYSRYGSQIHKQVYIYGGLDPSPTEVPRNFGMAWGMGGWLVTWFLQKIGPVDAKRLQDRVLAELSTTFASRYGAEITLPEMLSPKVIASYSKKATGEKFLVTPNKI